jgi:hypothetical protein
MFNVINNHELKNKYNFFDEEKNKLRIFLSSIKNNTNGLNIFSSSFSKNNNVNTCNINILKKYTYEEIEKITIDLIKQIKFLEKNNLTFIKLDLDDILIINDEICVISNIENCTTIKTEKSYEKESKIIQTININYPVTKNMFISPELDKITELPSNISYKNIYYNIGAIIIFIYLRKNIKLIQKNDDTLYGVKKYIEELTSIYNTKLYWFIINSCFIDNIDERILNY